MQENDIESIFTSCLTSTAMIMPFIGVHTIQFINFFLQMSNFSIHCYNYHVESQAYLLAFIANSYTKVDESYVYISKHNLQHLLDILYHFLNVSWCKADINNSQHNPILQPEVCKNYYPVKFSKILKGFLPQKCQRIR